jgi:DNA-binding MarR family transcriptional regulator
MASTRIRGKKDLARALLDQGRHMGTAAIMFHQAVADRLGLNPTDHKCLDLMRGSGGATAGELADWTGLTTGAVTGIIDRLERAGFVRREEHPTDRRKVVVRVIPERLPEVGRLFTSLGEAMTALCGHYSEAELRVIVDYLTRSADLFRRETRLLRAGAPDGRGTG